MKSLNIHSKVLRACAFIDSCQDYMPSLGEVADHVATSPTYLQKVFKKALGISPREYADCLRRERLKNALAGGQDICTALYEAGYGSSSRVYEKADQYMGMTPKQYQNKGQGKTIYYSIAKSPLGWMLVASTDRGICMLSIQDTKAALKYKLSEEFSQATLIEDDKQLQEWTQQIIDYLSGEMPWPQLPYDVQSTAFQRKVWDHLRTIPVGKTQQYGEIAEAVGRPGGARAVANACANNPVALIVPCHRVLPKSGGTGGYRLGPKRKERLLVLEGVLESNS